MSDVLHIINHLKITVQLLEDEMFWNEVTLLLYSLEKTPYVHVAKVDIANIFVGCLGHFIAVI